MQGRGLTYQWYKDGDELESETATFNTLVVRNPEVHHTGFYTVTVSNEAGSVQSARACMIVQLDAVQQASTRMKAASTGETAAARGGRAAARRRRMLDGAVARASTNPVDNIASDPPEDTHADETVPSLLTQAAGSEVEPAPLENDSG